MAEEILAEASHLFARKGVAATTMADIADSAGLQVSSLYYYFRSKHEILETIVGEVNRLPQAALAEARATYEDPATALHAFVRSDATCSGTHPDSGRSGPRPPAERTAGTDPVRPAATRPYFE